MFKKVKEYFKGKNPFLMASAAIVIVSVAIICLLLKNEFSAGMVLEPVSEDSQVSVEETIVNNEKKLGSEEGESSETDTIMQETVMSELSVLESVEISRESETASNVEIETEREETVSLDQESTPESEITFTPETLSEPEENVILEAVPDRQPEDIVLQEPEPESADETVAEAESQPEVMPQPEEKPLPEVIPEPEEIPEPEAPHEHSWIFESCYQEPTCSNGGLENQICAHCGETRIVGGTPTGEHDYVVETEGDCCSEEIVRCSVCNNREIREKNIANHIDVEDGSCYSCGQKIESE